jgi:hypothetical protein
MGVKVAVCGGKVGVSVGEGGEGVRVSVGEGGNGVAVGSWAEGVVGDNTVVAVRVSIAPETTVSVGLGVIVKVTATRAWVEVGVGSVGKSRKVKNMATTTVRTTMIKVPAAIARRCRLEPLEL